MTIPKEEVVYRPNDLEGRLPSDIMAAIAQYCAEPFAVAVLAEEISPGHYFPAGTVIVTCEVENGRSKSQRSLRFAPQS